jgi:hypothetical protein
MDPGTDERLLRSRRCWAFVESACGREDVSWVDSDEQVWEKSVVCRGKLMEGEVPRESASSPRPVAWRRADAHRLRHSPLRQKTTEPIEEAGGKWSAPFARWLMCI